MDSLIPAPVDHGVTVADGVATIVLDRAAAYNALTADLLESLIATLRAMQRDPRVRAIVLTGAGKAFCSGQALDDPRTFPSDAPMDLATALRERYHPLILTLLRSEIPLVAAVNGVAAGAGLGIALACDLRVIATTASFTTAFAKIGLVPDSGVSYLLPRMVGLGRAAELCLLAERFDARRAEALGLATAVVEPAALAGEARRYALALAAGPRSLGLIKRELAHNVLADAVEALAFEAELQLAAAATADFQEGLAAFREKRAPSFQGR